MTDRLIGAKHEAKVIALDRAFVSLLEQGKVNTESTRPGSEAQGPRIIPPQDAEEEELLQSLKREFEQQLAEYSTAEQQAAASVPSEAPGTGSPPEPERLKPAVKLRNSPDGGYYF